MVGLNGKYMMYQFVKGGGVWYVHSLNDKGLKLVLRMPLLLCIRQKGQYQNIHPSIIMDV